jgi:hypothetical protein
LGAELPFQLRDAGARAGIEGGGISRMIFAVPPNVRGDVSLCADGCRPLREPVGLKDTPGGEREERHGDRYLHDDHRRPETAKAE